MVDGLWREFFAGLTSDGRVMVAGPMIERPPSAELLISLEGERRASWPGGLPDFDPAAAEWGCRVIALGARLLSDRLVETGKLVELSNAGPEDQGPGTHYSVDLVLAVLPDLWRLASRRMGEDPLLGVLEDLGRRWPLSGVGLPVAQAELELLAPLRASAGLWTVFLDRVIAARNCPWLELEEVRRAVRNALGPERQEFLPERTLSARTRPEDDDGNDRSELH